MNKKFFLPLLALAIVPVLMLVAQDDDRDRADAIGKKFAAEYPGSTIGLSLSEGAITEKEEIRRAHLIIDGTILDAKPYWKIYYDNELPRIHTEYAVRIDDVIKGDRGLLTKTIKVDMFGGSLDGITAHAPGVKMYVGENVILLLGKDINSIFGDAYAPVSISKSIYKIENGQATNMIDDRSGSKDTVKQRISDMLR